MAAAYWVLVADELMTDQAHRVDWASIELEVIDRGGYDSDQVIWETWLAGQPAPIAVRG